MADQDYAIGIDLGTSNSCVGVFRNGRVDIIANEQGSRLTPSFVAFTDEERLIGESAKYQRHRNPRNTLYEVKRLIGRKFSDENVQKYKRQWPFTVTNNNGNPKLNVEYRGAKKTFTPEEISAMVLERMKEIAESYLGCKIRKAVVTVPAYFTDSQRQATIDAGTIAGLDVLKIINEPTAAAIAYGEDANIQAKKKTLIFDFGGGTFDVSILTMMKGDYEVKAVSGNTDLGGADLDTRLCEHLLSEFRKKTGVDCSSDEKAQAKIRSAAEQIKIHLSAQMKDHIQIECLYQGKDLDVVVTRTKFEHLCDDLINETMTYVDDALDDAKLTAGSIDDVVLVGGSSWIPKIQNMLTKKFSAKCIKRNINPAEAVAYGAAIQAAMLNKDRTVKDVRLTDVIPHSLGTALIFDIMQIIIERNSKIPARSTEKITTVFPFTHMLIISIYEGENPVASKNRCLGKFVADGIQIAPAGVPEINVTFEVDSNGILSAKAVDCATGGGGHIEISINKGRLEKKDIEGMVTEMRNIRTLENDSQAVAKVSVSLESTIAEKEKLLLSLKNENKISNRGYKRLTHMCRETEIWMESHKHTGKEYEKKGREFNASFTSVLSRARVSH